MLFTELGFLFLFLPAVFLAVRGLQFFGANHETIVVLALASLVFYGIAHPPYLLLLATSILVNYALVRLFLSWERPSGAHRRAWLVVNTAFNLGMLGYFKYRDFFLDNFVAASGTNFNLEPLILPVGISFYVFEQLALAVDVYRGYRPERSLLTYGLWVAFFPHLVAGPIMRHQELVPQFSRRPLMGPWADDLAVGLTIFTLGLFKKAVLADAMAPLASAGFSAAHTGAIGSQDAWVATVAYALQIYFDFSGYSDMAIGLARMFGMSLPLNFNSPYKAASIIEFWRRWHMTLSRFLRDYLYIPLGGGKHGTIRRWINLFLTMLLGGLWHGASWNFVIWGGLHGSYLAVNHAFRHMVPQRELGNVGHWFGWLLTMIAVLIAWVPFRAGSLPEALTMWQAMAGLSDIGSELFDVKTLLGIAFASAVALLMPNTQEFMGAKIGGEVSALPSTMGLINRWVPGLSWTPGYVWSAAIGVMIAASLLCLNDGQSPFIYFRF
jgi:alginate O-acetyltransferase complex protein AlgI